LINIVPRLLEAKIVEPEETAVVNTLPQQPTFGSGVFYVVHAEVM
jgi:hypothetical protein